ncbi:MAG: hypothetical protein EAZ59_11550, partial [Oscillatoriales cyanobacterium]
HRMRVWAIRATTGGLPLQRMKQPCLCRGGAPVPARRGGDRNLMGKAIEYAAGSEGSLSFMFS